MHSCLWFVPALFCSVTYVDEALARGELMPVLERYTLRDAVWAAWPRSRFTPPKVSRFLDEVQAALQTPAARAAWPMG